MERKTKIKFTDFECNLLINGFKNSPLHYYLLLFTSGNPSRRAESEERRSNR